MLDRQELTADGMVLMHHLMIQMCHRSWKEATQTPSATMIVRRAQLNGSVVAFVIAFSYASEVPGHKELYAPILAMMTSLPPLLGALRIQEASNEKARYQMSRQVAGMFREAAIMKGP
jgi:hypothetical protein